MRTYVTLSPPYPLYAIVRTWLDPSPPHLCVRTRWMTPSFENIWFPKVKHNGARRYLTDKFDTKYSRVDQVNFVEDSLYKIWRDMICLSRPYLFKFFKGCLPQILLGPLLNTFYHLIDIVFMVKTFRDQTSKRNGKIFLNKLEQDFQSSL